MTEHDHKLIAQFLREFGETGQTYADAIKAVSRALQADNPRTFDRQGFERAAGLVTY